MKCPYCGKEMIAGEVRGDGRKKVKFWVCDNDENKFIQRSILKVSSTGFPGFNFRLNAFACYDCNKIIIDKALY